METKFTKGDWVVVNRAVRYPHGHLMSATTIPVDDSRLEKESWLEMLHRTGPAREKAEEESLANIRLIAQSPRMYEELMDIRVTLVVLRGNIYASEKVDKNWDGMTDVIQQRIDVIDSLLAAARGES